VQTVQLLSDVTLFFSLHTIHKSLTTDYNSDTRNFYIADPLTKISLSAEPFPKLSHLTDSLYTTWCNFYRSNICKQETL